MECTRPGCQVAPRTLTMAAFRPSCASEITSFAPRRPRRARLRRNSTQNGSASLWPTVMPSRSRPPALFAPGLGVPDVHAEPLAPPVVVDADRDDHRDRDDGEGASGFAGGAVKPDIGP